jgi:hypothetical protein
MFLLLDSDIGHLDRLKQLLLIAAYRHEKIFGLDDRIPRALTACRLLIARCDRPDTMVAISAIPDFTKLLSESDLTARLSNVVRCFTNSIESSDTNSTVYNRFLPIRRLLQDVLEERKRKERQFEGRGSKADIGFYVDSFSVSISGDVDFAPYIEFREGPLNDEKNQRSAEYVQDSTEYSRDNLSSRSYIAIGASNNTPAWVSRNSALLAVQSRNMIQQIERREKQLVSSWSSLTRHEVSVLIQGFMDTDETAQKIKTMVAVMFCTGREFDEILSARCVKNSSQIVKPGNCYGRDEQSSYWFFLPKLPIHRQKEKFRKLISVQNNPIKMVLPAIVGDLKLLSSMNSQCKSEVAQWLNDINARYSTRITMNRVSDYLGYYLHHLGHDDVIIALLTGDLNIQHAGVFYYQYDCENLASIHLIFLTRFGLVDKEFSQVNSGLGGSQLQVTPDAVAALFAHQRLLVERSRQQKSRTDFHNHYVMYVLFLLNLATGHRPVNDPYDDLTHIDLIGKKIFISDKEIRHGDASRTLVLPQLAIDQINRYISHLRVLQQEMFLIGSAASTEIRAVLDGNAPVLFFLEDQPIELVSVRPKTIRDQVRDYFDLPQNWHRHYLRTAMSQWGITGESIDTYMGHAKPGQEGLASYSGMSIVALKNIANRIDDEFEQRGISALAGWGRHE